MFFCFFFEGLNELMLKNLLILCQDIKNNTLYIVLMCKSYFTVKIIPNILNIIKMNDYILYSHIIIIVSKKSKK